MLRARRMMRLRLLRRVVLVTLGVAREAPVSAASVQCFPGAGILGLRDPLLSAVGSGDSGWNALDTSESVALESDSLESDAPGSGAPRSCAPRTAASRTAAPRSVALGPVAAG